MICNEIEYTLAYISQIWSEIGGLAVKIVMKKLHFHPFLTLNHNFHRFQITSTMENLYDLERRDYEELESTKVKSQLFNGPSQ